MTADDTRREYLAAYADVAAFTMAGIADPDAARQAREDMLTTGSVAELRTALAAALDLAEAMLAKDVEHSAREHDGTPGPVLSYVVTVARRAADLPKST